MAYPPQEDSQQECPICMEAVDMQSGSRCPAGICNRDKYIFHPDCLNQWLSSHTSCPLCRGRPLTPPPLPPPLPGPNYRPIPAAPTLPPMQQIMPSQYRLDTPSFLNQIQDQQQRVFRTGDYNLLCKKQKLGLNIGVI